MRFTLLCSVLLATLVLSASLRATEQRALENSEAALSLLQLTSEACDQSDSECLALKTDNSEATTNLLQTDCKTTNGSEAGEEEQCL